MPLLRQILLNIAPHGIVLYLKNKRHLGSYEIKSNIFNHRKKIKALQVCRYDLWPACLRSTKQPWILADIGANKGQFLGAVAMLHCPSHAIIVEPLESCRVDLMRESSAILSVDFFPVALGSQTGFITINETRDTVFSSILEPIEHVSDGYGLGQGGVLSRHQVQMLTLDVLFEKITVGTNWPVGLLKIDVQGYELNVLSGAESVLRRTEAVLIETNYLEHYSGASSFEENHKFLTHCGFCLSAVSEPVSIGGVPHWADAVYRRKDSLFA